MKKIGMSSFGPLALAMAMMNHAHTTKLYKRSRQEYEPPMPQIPDGTIILLRHDDDINVLARNYDNLSGCKVIQAEDEEDYARLLAEYAPKAKQDMPQLADGAAYLRKHGRTKIREEYEHVTGSLPVAPRANGLKRFEIDGKEVWAINRKNAERKARKS